MGVDAGYPQSSSAPLFGRRGEPLSAETLKAIAGRMAPAAPMSADRARQWKRWRILQNDVGDLIAAKISEQYHSEVVKQGTAEHITPALNPAADVCGQVCQVYRHGVRRTLNKSKASTQKAFQNLYREAGILGIGPDWNKIAYFCGPLVVFPQVRGKLMRVETILPHRRVLVLDEENPTGAPIAVAYLTATTTVTIVTYTDVQEYEIRGGYLTPIGEPLRRLSGAQNDASPFPALRFDAPIDPCDWDNSHKQERLAAISLDVGVVASVLGYTRSTQHQWLLAIAGRLASMPKGQNLANPSKPLMFELTGSETLQMETLNWDTPVTSFADHIRLWYAAAGDATGVPSVIHGDGVNIDIEFAYDGLTELRREQVSYADPFETELACAMVQAAIDGGHPDAALLPDVATVRKDFRVTFGRMARRFTDPTQERDQIDWEIRHGLMSVVDVLAERYPTAAPEDLLEAMKKTLTINSEVWDWMAQRNGVGVDGKTTVPEKNGAKGPKERDKDKVKPDANA